MSRRSNHTVGAMHPVLFFVFVYAISLFLAFFICTTIYNNLHPDASYSVAAEKSGDYVLAQGNAKAVSY